MSLSTPGIKFFNPAGPAEYFHAQWIVLSSARVIENGYLEVDGGQIKSISRIRPQGPVRDLGPGVILPALVNAHVHLELSALAGAVPFDRGFTAWVRELLVKREALGEEKLRLEAGRAAAALTTQGTGIVGEISTLGITRNLLEIHGVSGVWFREVLGGMREADTPAKGRTVSFSMAGHAPHTTGPEVLKDLKRQTVSRGLPFSIHLAESRSESEFMETGKGGWADFLASRGIDISTWPVGNTSPVQYLNRLGILGNSTLAVHLLQTDERDMGILAETGTRICLCPRSNENLHQRLPQIKLMLDKGLEPALGTDSLASCDSLSLFDETAFVRSRYPDIAPETVFKMATANGARALGLNRNWGSLDPGKRACFLYADLDTSNKNQIFERLTCNEI